MDWYSESGTEHRNVILHVRNGQGVPSWLDMMIWGVRDDQHRTC